MTRLEIPVPPLIESSLDISESYVLHLRLFHNRDGTPLYSDGRAVGPVHEPGLLAYVSHPADVPGLPPGVSRLPMTRRPTTG